MIDEQFDSDDGLNDGIATNLATSVEMCDAMEISAPLVQMDALISQGCIVDTSGVVAGVGGDDGRHRLRRTQNAHSETRAVRGLFSRAVDQTACPFSTIMDRCE
eukprot:SAG11_NODE_12248_length_713_cov_1.258958_1_plen_103_part_10